MEMEIEPVVVEQSATLLEMIGAGSDMLLPVFALISWTLVMFLWMYATRIPAMQKAGIDPQKAKHPGTYADAIPSSVRQVADNYNHLHESPTIFYALAFYLVLSGGADSVAVYLAWGYVALRVIHSLLQATVNLVLLRFMLFSVSVILMIVMAVREGLRLFL